MALDCLSFTNWLGWFTGIWFVYPQRKSSLKFSSWFDPGTIFPIFLSLISTALWFDFLLHYITSVEKNVVRRLLTMSLTSFGLILNTYVRFVFGWQIKKVCKLVSQLETHANNPFGNNRKSPIEIHERIILGIVFSLQAISVAFITYAVFARREKNLQNSWLEVLSNWQYTAIFCLIGAISKYLMEYVAFAIVLIITKYSLNVLMDFCDQFESAISIGNQSQFKLSVSVYEREVVDIRTIGFKKLKETSEFIKNSLLKKLDSMVELFQLYDEVMGYILFGIITLNLVLVLLRLNNLLTWSLPAIIIFDSTSLMSQVIQATTIILLLGHQSHVEVSGIQF